MHGCTGPISFKGAEVGCPNFLHCLPENEVVLPEYYMIFFVQIWLFEKF